MADCPYFSEECPSRLLFDQITDKWTMMVLSVLDGGPMRFNALRRQIEGVTQKALTQCLRRMESNGFIKRRVLTTSPVAVEYELLDLGRSLKKPLLELHNWTISNIDLVMEARKSSESELNLEV